MEYEIYPVSQQRINDFLYFFDTAAFSDHKEWDGCYCVFYHIADDNDKTIDRRKLAIELIAQKKLCGYLAYLNNEVIGWCNTADKTTYPLLVSDKTLWDDDGIKSSARIKSVVCFTISPPMRSKGVATQLLSKVCSDAKDEQYDFVEGYPQKNAQDNFGNYRGPLNVYKKLGFELYKELQDDWIFRKNLKAST
jgi:GNAT superfamily N-acetyltransferase